MANQMPTNEETAHQEQPRSINDKPTLKGRLKKIFFGTPRDLTDKSIFHRISLIPFLAWVGLGADGLSSSAYGPEEAFRTLGEHTYIAVALAILMVSTVFIISSAYSHIIEEFPRGGGGYVVATKLLGERIGVVSGCALLVDYVLTITVSIAAAGDALFSFMPLAFHMAKLPTEVALIVALIILNVRGVRESTLVLTPVFLVFIATHFLVITGGLAAHTSELPATARAVGTGFEHGLTTLGFGGMALLFFHAYSLGGGTYTGIEAVSNGLAIMREPVVRTAKRTMLYMSTSLAFTASGLLVCYLLWRVAPEPGKTMNAVLVESMTQGFSFGEVFLIITLFSEGALLVVAAQAGFIDGPRVLANMAIDSWVPRRFAALSDRLTTHNGIFLMGGAGLLALYWTKGNVHQLVVMYSINVFLTFSLSMLAMIRSCLASRSQKPRWKRLLSLFCVGFSLCATILVITVMEKFHEGGWITLLATGGLLAVCFLIKSHYREVGAKLIKLYTELGDIPGGKALKCCEIDPERPTAAVLVAGFGGLGIHTILNLFRSFPDYFKNVVFLSVGVLDSGEFKGGENSIDLLRRRTEEMLGRYVDLVQGFGISATYRLAIGTDAVDEAEKLCIEISSDFPNVTFFAGKIIFEKEKWYHRLLHNETAFAIQKRLQWAGKAMVVLPARVE